MTAQSSGQPSTTFRTQTTLVLLDVRVADREGNFVSDLAADDFEVLVDGTPQRIAAFDLVRLQTDAPTATWKSPWVKRSPSASKSPDTT